MRRLWPPQFDCAERPNILNHLAGPHTTGVQPLLTNDTCNLLAVGCMYRDLVEKRHWISESNYKDGMGLAQLMPGPLAAQLSIHLGDVHYPVWGATLVGLAFVLPSFLMVVAIGGV